MIIFHVFLKNNLLVTNPTARPRREDDWDVKYGPWNSGSASGINAACALAVVPERAQEGTAWVEARRSGPCQCSVLGRIRSKEAL